MHKFLNKWLINSVFNLQFNSVFNLHPITLTQLTIHCQNQNLMYLQIQLLNWPQSQSYTDALLVRLEVNLEGLVLCGALACSSH